MKKAIKAISLIICLAICLSALAACADKKDSGPSGSASPSGSPSGSSKPSPWANADGSVNLDEVAYYDPDYDYTQNERYKFKYLVVEAPTALHENVSMGFGHWCPIMNMQYDGMVSSNGDIDLYLSLLQNHIDQGYRGFVLDPNAVMIEAVAEIVAANPDCAWMSLMMPPRLLDSARPEDAGTLIRPWAGFDHYVIGEMFAERLIQWKNETFPDVPWEEFGHLCVDASAIPPLHQRVLASTTIFREAGMPESNILIADTAAYSFSIDGAIQAATPVVTTNDHIKYWLVNALHDDFAQAAAMVIDSVGLTDTSCIVSMGGPGFQAQSDAGQQNAFRFVLSAPEYVQCEVFIGAVYAFLNGWATPDNIWPMWVNVHDCGGPGKTYANMMLPAYWISFEDYQAFFQWSAVYAEADDFNYGVPGITRDSWPNRVAVPPYYH